MGEVTLFLSLYNKMKMNNDDNKEEFNMKLALLSMCFLTTGIQFSIFMLSRTLLPAILSVVTLAYGVYLFLNIRKGVFEIKNEN